MSRIALNDIPGMAAAPAPFSRAVWAGDHLWVSGRTGMDRASGQLVKGGAGAETMQAPTNLSAVLKAAGLG
jgi:2-iminobutanoate/2-iminopropanoate deaminase